MKTTHHVIFYIISFNSLIILSLALKFARDVPQPSSFSFWAHEKRLGRPSTPSYYRSSGKLIRKRGLHNPVATVNEVVKAVSTTSEKSEELKSPAMSENLKDVKAIKKEKASDLLTNQKTTKPKNQDKKRMSQNLNKTSDPHHLPSDKGSRWTKLSWSYLGKGLKKFWNWIKSSILRRYKRRGAQDVPAKHSKQPIRMYHVVTMEESPFGKMNADVSEKARLESLELLNQRLSSLTASEDPEGVSKTQLKLLNQRSSLEGFALPELKPSLTDVAISQISSFKSSISLREAEWQLLQHIFTFSEDTSVRNLLYEQYQVDAEFRRAVTFASDTFYLRDLRHLQLSSVNTLYRELLDLLRVSNWGEKEVEDERASAVEDLFLEVIKDNRIDTSGLKSLLHIPEILENVSLKSLSRMRAILSKDHEFMSIMAIVSNQARPGILSENLPESSWMYRLLKDHEAAPAFDQMVQSEFAGVSTWANSASEALKERKDSTERKKLISLFEKLVPVGSPGRLELKEFHLAFLDPQNGKPWFDEKNVNLLVDRCLSIFLSETIETGVKAWVHAVLEHIQNYNLPAFVNKIQNVFDKNQHTLTDIDTYWYMESRISTAGNDLELEQVRRFALRFQRLTTKTGWNQVLAESMTFRETMEKLIQELKNDRISMAKGRLHLYEMFIFVLNHFEAANNRAFISALESDESFNKCQSALSILSGISIPHLKSSREATGFGLGLNKDLTVDQPYLELLRARGQPHDTVVTYDGPKDRLTRESLVNELRQLRSEEGFSSRLMNNLADRLCDLRNIARWDPNDVYPVNSHSMTEAMLFYVQDKELNLKAKQFISRVLELLMEHNENALNLVMARIKSEPELQEILDWLHYLNTCDQIPKRQTINPDILDVKGTVTQITSRPHNNGQNLGLFDQICEKISSKIVQGGWTPSEHRILSASIMYLSERNSAWKTKFTIKIFERDVTGDSATIDTNFKSFVFEYNLFKDSLDLRPIDLRMTQSRILESQSSVETTTSSISVDEHFEVQQINKLLANIEEIKQNQELNLNQQENIHHLTTILQNGIDFHHWDPPTDYNSEETLYYLVTKTLMGARKIQSSIGERLVYSLILEYIEGLPRCPEAKALVESVIRLDYQLQKRVLESFACLDMQRLVIDESISSEVRNQLKNIWESEAHEWNTFLIPRESNGMTANRFAQLITQGLEEERDVYPVFRFLDLLSQMSKTFCERFLDIASQDEVLANKIGEYLAHIYTSLDENIMPSESIQHYLLKDTTSGQKIMRQYILTKMNFHQETESQEFVNLYRELSELPSDWNSAQSTAGSTMFESALMVLKNSQIQEAHEGQMVQIPNDVLLAFYILYYLERYDPSFDIREGYNVAEYIFGNNLHHNLQQISKHINSLICGSEFFKMHPTFKSPMVPSDFRNNQV
ncbi:hypothetical protein CROQUDRAFT_172141 [Cronartium quercuum f. sp. fusiforme G11]|uniref:Uncharacterized protein n=1 Tax=Cronartium quercuum f. sp. fusiforme G11 TaxID=708437 RepID=A0A9P6TAJ1_9BASI|nr:hypothetical protein CROQUDRAFT_172141 [Cronartium quercuum f. sp. fusiforme G11]